MRTAPALGAVLLLAAAAAAAAPDGAALYGRHCAACHGDDGSGGVGVPLALPDFLATMTDRYLAETVRRGRPGRVMPAFPELSEEEVAAIVAHVRRLGGVPAPRYAPRPARGDAARGARLYARHGAAGEGGRGTGVAFARPRDLPVVPPALANPGFAASVSDEELRATLLRGRRGTPMPAAADLGLSGEDVEDLVAHLRRLGSAAAPRAAGRDEPALLEAESAIGLEETVEAVKRAVVGQNFRLIRVQYLDQGLVPEGTEDRRRVIVYFCNFAFLYEALAIDPRVGLFLPCRVTVVADGDRVRVMAVNPKRLSVLFNNAELDAACARMAEIYRAILEEATL
ncbi:c-type cytochrome [Inmirania thermothiophila]|uniref:Cytochrome c oxidase cbb3-type subunit 3 n=1 Tax=Inmirania thermothiophila TaxID=1750597 RepID=A0A3N1Y6H0_9GAMM|nr:c-type cytochrome [Inmirania thermothiophila]ROR34404.1 cytochrome c oxidase cbb3-type subunit 3 [Inmirania thermothiophila]